MTKLRGCGTALVTPFLADGAVDVKSLRALVAWQIESGIDFLVPAEPPARRQRSLTMSGDW